eukprot:INCI13513.1.p1 GENE.INCI13513.1~~INCI13513.1.p1  ORF type:complete len:366 (+),score=81.15 INCI13513.1:133-1098(+)
MAQKSEYANLLPVGVGGSGSWTAKIRSWLAEDIPKFDIGGFVVGDAVSEAKILMKSPGVMAGVPFVDEVFKAVNCTVTWHLAEGEEVGAEQAQARLPVATVRGPVRNLLLGERTALNIMSRASGVATLARETRVLVEKEKWHGTVAATRKTTPGFGFIEKYGVIVGGCSTHRMDLSSMVMLKDNHVWSSGSIEACTRRAKQVAGHATKIEVECRDLEEAIEAANAGADVVMLDNFSPEQLLADAKEFKKQFPHVLVEASGGITKATISQFLSPDVDVVSQGSLTQGYRCLDFSMKLPNPTLESTSSGAQKNVETAEAVVEP